MKLDELLTEAANKTRMIVFCRGDDGDDDAESLAETAEYIEEVKEIFKEHGAKILKQRDDPPIFKIEVKTSKADELYEELDEATAVRSIQTDEYGPLDDDPFESPLKKMTSDPEVQAKLAARTKKKDGK